MPRWLACALAAACALPTIEILRSRGDVALAGPGPIAQVLAVGAGLLLVLAAAAARPDTPVRPRLLAFAGAAWLAAEWASPAARGALVFTAGLVAAGLALPVVLAAVPAVPRTATLIAVAGALLIGPLAAMAVDPRDVGCSDCPADLLAVASNADLADTLWRVGAWLSLAACAAAVVLLVVGSLRESPAARRRVLPVALPAAAFACATGAGLWLELRGGSAAPGTRTAHLLAAGALVGIALGSRVRPLLLRRARRAVTAATVAVGAGEGEPMAGVLSAIVDDPAPTLLYAVPDQGWTDAAGHAASLPVPGSSRQATIIEDGGAPLAALVHEGDPPEEDVLGEALAAGRLRLDAERLQAAALARVEALRAARRMVVAATDAERSRLERDLHDGAQQRLVALRFALGLARSRAGTGELAARLAIADSALERALAELRELAHGLYPASLDGAGLATAIPAVAERSAIAVAVGALPTRRFATDLERSAYRIVAEALALAEGAGARGARVEAVADADRLVVRIEHDGANDGQPGLDLLDDRVQSLAGTLHRSRTPSGAALVADVPCA